MGQCSLYWQQQIGATPVGDRAGGAPARCLAFAAIPEDGSDIALGDLALEAMAVCIGSA